MEGPEEQHLLVIAELNMKENRRVKKPVKYIAFGFAIIYWILGAVFCAVGGYIVSQSIDYEDLSEFAMVPGMIAIILGFVIFIFSTFGILGIIRENLCLLKVYRIFVLCVLIFEVFCGFVSVAYWPEVKKMVDANVERAIEQYHMNPKLTSMIDMIQRHLECCGSLSVDDWDSNPYYRCRQLASIRSCGVPWSCCLGKFYRNRHCGLKIRANRHKVDIEKTVHTAGCLDKGFSFFENNLTIIAVIVLICTLPLIIEIFLIATLKKQVTSQIKQYNKLKEEKVVPTSSAVN